MATVANAQETWSFATPPSAVRVEMVEADWSEHGKVEIDLELLESTGEGDLQCSLFFQNKQDYWFESAKPLLLKEGRATISLSLDDRSLDWRASGARRAFEPDTLRHVRRWGVKLFSMQPRSGKLTLGELRFLPRQSRTPHILAVHLPRNRKAAQLNTVEIEIGGVRGNPYDPEQVRGSLVWSGNASGKTPLAFRQPYTRLEDPITGDVRYESLGPPHWRAGWVPPSPGEYELAIEMTTGGQTIQHGLGSILIGDAGEEKHLDAPEVPVFSLPYQGPRPFQYRLGRWDFPERDVPMNAAWEAPIEWTAEWGHFVGLGDYNQKIAWQVEREIMGTSADQAAPVQLFSADELDDYGTYNWKDHPLNAANGGDLERPSHIFTSAEARDYLVRKAQYLWARFGGYSSVTGIVINLNRPEDDAVDWINSIAAEIAKVAPDIPLLSTNPALPERWDQHELRLASSWETDTRLSKGTSVKQGEGGVVVTANYPGDAAITCKKLQHWSGGRVFAVDIKTPDNANDEIKVLCMLRTAKNTVFQSKLMWLRGGEWNRVFFPFDDPRVWTCLQEPERDLVPYDMLNLEELGLRFFYDEDASQMPLVVRNDFLHGPYTVEFERRPFAIEQLTGNESQIEQYRKLELDFLLNRTFANPYDPEEIDVHLQVMAPDGQVLTHPGFYNEPYNVIMDGEYEVARRNGAPSWKIRFTPEMTGEYKYSIIAKTPRERTETKGSFTAVAGDGMPFLRISQQDPRYFETSDGEFFYPIGHNLRSPSDHRPGIYGSETMANVKWADAKGTRAFEKWFEKMSENGENLTRVWMCPWWCGLEWSIANGYHGLGYYKQENAARLDRIMELGEQYGMYINLETINHGALSSQIDADWRDSPYSDQQPEGFLRHATDFFSSERALKLHRQKLRYSVARWGYSPALAWWGVITEGEWVEPYHRGIGAARPNKNEVSWMPIPYKTKRHQATFVDWLDEMSAFLMRTDAHSHPASGHYSNPGNGIEAWQKQNLRIVHNNAYTYFVGVWNKTPTSRATGCADVIHIFADEYQHISPNRPLIIGEWGGHVLRNLESHLVAELHTGMWSMVMTRCAGPTGYWWWNLIDSMDLYPQFRAVANFAEGEDRRGKDYVGTRARLRFSGDANRKGLVLSESDHLYAFVYHDNINRRKDSYVPKGFEDSNFAKSGDGHLRVPDTLQDGTYTVEYWNTFSGKPIGTESVTISSSQREIPVMDHRVSLALKLKRQ